MKRQYYLFAILALCVVLAISTCTANAQTPADISQDQYLARDQARQDKVTAKNTLTLAESLADKTAANNDAQDVANLEANVKQDELAVIVAMIQDERVATNAERSESTATRVAVVEEQSITDRQILGVMAAVLGILFVSIWYMMYRATTRLEGASKDTWRGVELILLRTALLQAYLEKEAPEVVEQYEAVLKEVEGKDV